MSNVRQYRTVEEIMAEFGAKGKESDLGYLQDVLVRLDWMWRNPQAQQVEEKPRCPHCLGANGVHRSLYCASIKG